jgi:predicted sulfurtransferase
MGMVFERPGIILLSEGEERVYHLKGGELRRLESLGWGHIGKFFGGCAANRG